jgi:asparagine synthase (glutamine-hydrolysing)
MPVSGVFGLFGPPMSPVPELCERMGRAMAHRPWHVVERFAHHELPLAVGRVGIGIFNRLVQPVWDEPRRVAVFLAGEIYGTNGIERQSSDEATVLHAYETAGGDFPRCLNGSFVTAICDLQRHRLLVANDRFGLYPTYYVRSGEWFAFAPEVKALLVLRAVPRDLDEVALAQYMRFQHVLGTRTFFSAISLLAPATVIHFDLDSRVLTGTRYWWFDAIPYDARISFDDAADHAAHLLGAAVRRMSGDEYRPGVFLSGGLDSRMLLGSVARRPIVSVTFGHPDCRDVRYASRIAAATGSDHRWFPFHDGRWVLKVAEQHLELTEGFHSWIHAHGMSMLTDARQLMQVNLTGWDGGTVMGYPTDFDPRLTDAVDDFALVERVFECLTNGWTWPSISDGEERLLYTPHWRSRLCGLAFDSLRDEFAQYLGLRCDARAQFFFLANHCGRFTIHMLTFARSHLEVRCPFFDYALIDFIYSLPNEHRTNRRLGRAVLRRLAPRLARIPHDVDDVIPDDRAWRRSTHSTWITIKRRINRHVTPLFREWATLYADYEGYLRSDLREWAESILFDRRTTERGIFSPDSVRSLWLRHQSGRELHTIGKIAPIMTYELMLRRLIDQP